MYGHIGNEFSYNNLGHFPLPDITSTTTEPLILPHLTIPSNNLDSLSAFKSDSSGCSSYIGSPASITSYGTHTSTLIQRSISSHSLQKNYEGYSQLDSSPVRKVLSTGDLQVIHQLFLCRIFWIILYISFLLLLIDLIFLLYIQKLFRGPFLSVWEAWNFVIVH